MTKALLKSCNKKAALFKKYRKTTTEPAKSIATLNYTKYLNSLRKLLKAAESNYCAEKFNKVSSDIKKTWSLLNTILNKNGKKSPLSSLAINDVLTSDPQQIVNILNDYFINIGTSLAATFTTIESDCSRYLTNSYPNSMAFLPTTTNEIINIVSEFQIKLSVGHDNIPVSLI